MIDGVVVKELITHADERGFFREIVRVTDDLFEEGFGQWSHSLMYTGTAKAWHVHRQQTDWWYIGVGTLKVALFDTRPESSTHGQLMELLMGEDHPAQVIKIPPGVAHGCKAINGPAHLFYITSRIYDPADEGRIPHNSPEIGYDWTALPPIK
jgi:dTDP-4-dehydrorhamnose 3,5-epimerase